MRGAITPATMDERTAGRRWGLCVERGDNRKKVDGGGFGAGDREDVSSEGMESSFTAGTCLELDNNGESTILFGYVDMETKDASDVGICSKKSCGLGRS